MNLETFVTRKDEIIATALRAGRQRAMSTAHELSRGGSMAAAAELVNQAVTKLIELAYERDETGLCNVDAAGVFVRFPVPWGRSYMRYGLRSTEAAVLRLHINKLMSTANPPPLWTYDEVTRRWGVNLWDYPKLSQALAYWKRVEISARDYKQMLQVVQTWRKPNSSR